MIATLVQLMGEDKAFDYLKGLHKNIGQYTRSGTGADQGGGARRDRGVDQLRPRRRRGEKMQGFPVETVTPSEGTGAEIGSMSIVKGARNLEQAKKFYEWALTPQAQQFGAAAKQYQLPSNKATPVDPQRARLQEDQADRLRLREVRRERRAPPPDRALGEGSQLAAALSATPARAPQRRRSACCVAAGLRRLPAAALVCDPGHQLVRAAAPAAMRDAGAGVLQALLAGQDRRALDPALHSSRRTPRMMRGAARRPAVAAALVLGGARSRPALALRRRARRCRGLRRGRRRQRPRPGPAAGRWRRGRRRRAGAQRLPRSAPTRLDASRR